MSLERNPRAAENVPLGAFILLGLSYLVLMLGLALFAGHDGISRFVLIIATLGVTPIFALPFWMLKGDVNYKRSSIADFLWEGINIESGHSSGISALTQMLLVPVCVWIFLLGILLFT